MLARLAPLARRPAASLLRSRARALCANPPSIPGGRAFLESELPAVVDLFHDFANADAELDSAALSSLLAAIGERPSPRTLDALFTLADSDGSGAIDLDEFLAASDRLLGDNPARCILVVGGPGSGKGLLCDRLVRECDVSHVSCGDSARCRPPSNQSAQPLRAPCRRPRPDTPTPTARPASRACALQC